MYLLRFVQLGWQVRQMLFAFCLRGRVALDRQRHRSPERDATQPAPTIRGPNHVAPIVARLGRGTARPGNDCEPRC